MGGLTAAAAYAARLLRDEIPWAYAHGYLLPPHSRLDLISRSVNRGAFEPFAHVSDEFCKRLEGHFAELGSGRPETINKKSCPPAVLWVKGEPRMRRLASVV